MPRVYFVYIMASVSRTLYIGITNSLCRRVAEHQRKLIPGFTQKYNVRQLVHFETTSSVRAAIARKKQIKAWLRSNKIVLVEAGDPAWRGLSGDWEPAK